MTNEKSETKAFIEDAKAGGWNEASAWFDGVLIPEKMLLDPLAWQSVGKTRGWGPWSDGCPICGDDERADSVPVWHQTMLHFIDHLADGKDIDTSLSLL